MSILKRIGGLFERRATVRTPPDWLYSALAGAGKTASGQTVGPDTALTLSCYYAAIRSIAEDCAKLPLILYKRLEPRGKERATAHRLYHLLHAAPNPDMTSMTFRETMTLHAIGWGNGYAEIVRADDGSAQAMWPIDPRRVRIERDDDKQIQYVVSPAGDGTAVTLAAKDMLHLHGLGFDGLTGYSVARLARESIGAALAAEQHGASLFANSSRPSGVLCHPGEIGEEGVKALRDGWESMYKGSENAHKTAILEDGVEFKPIGLPNKDAQWIESREFMVSELCRWLRIPPHKIGHLIDATYSNIESQSREYVVDCLQPWLVRWEQEIARKLIPARSPLFAEHLVDGLLRGDTETRYNAYASAINAGWMSRNEARVLENLNPADGLDEFLVPLNTGSVGEANDDPDTENPLS